jgi:catechol 2,3-dioxygenase-like lactoylglutathione lyase family enzyme
MGDGSFLAFFDLGDGEGPLPSPNTPEWVTHIALEVPDEAALRAAKARLEAAGHTVVGITDHHFIRSIYVFDPNGLRVELTTRTMAEAELAAHTADPHAKLAAWSAKKAARG